MLVKLLIPVLASFLGYCANRYSCVSERWLKHLSQSVSYVLLPSVIIAAMANINITPSLYQLPIVTVLVLLGLFIISWIYTSLKKMPAPEQGAFLTAFVSLEGGSIGLALTLLLYGYKALPAFFIFDIINALLLFTATYFIACKYGTKQEISWQFIRNFFVGPIPLSVILGLLIHFIFGGMSLFISDILNSIGYLILPAVMFILGYRFIFSPHHIIPSLVTLFIKMAAGFLIAWFLISFFHMEGYEKVVMLLGASLPPSLLVIIFAEEQGLSKDFIVTFLPLAAIISFFVLYFVFSSWFILP